MTTNGVGGKLRIVFGAFLGEDGVEFRGLRQFGCGEVVLFVWIDREVEKLASFPPGATGS